MGSLQVIDTPLAKGTIQRIVCPPPGVYNGVDFETYKRWDALNHSTLKMIAKSPAHFRYARDHGRDTETTSKRFGTATHELLLEPDKFDKRVLRGPVNPRTQECYGDTTKAWADFAAAHPGCLIVSDEDMRNLRAMAEAVRTHDDLGPLLAAPGDSEVCIVWDCRTTGLRCKARIDRRIKTAVGMIRLDLKTCEDGDDVSVSNSMVRHGYNTQDSFYALGCVALGLTDMAVFASIEKEPPYGINVWGVGPQTALASDEIVAGWLSTVKKCLDAGEWPCYEPGIRKIEAPTWWMSKFCAAEV